VARGHFSRCPCGVGDYVRPAVEDIGDDDGDYDNDDSGDQWNNDQ